MAISGIGVIESGLGGTIPIRNTFSYSLKTPFYQLPILGPGQQISATDEKTIHQIVENQLVGISRSHTVNNGVMFQGVYNDVSDYTVNNCIVSVSGIAAFIDRIYVGDLPETFAWSGLSSSTTNYLWMSLVEQNTANIGFLSSRQFRDFECRSTLTNNVPIGPQDSVLVATYTSGTGISVLPKVPLVGDHVSNNINPHGINLYVNDMLTSGVVVMGLSRWNYNAVSGMAPSGIPFSNVTYENQLIINSGTTLICSGVQGLIQSGLGNFTFFPPGIIQNISSALYGSCGNLIVVSGCAISGAAFNQNINNVSGISIDGLQFPLIYPQLIDGRQLSGIPVLHSHSLVSESVSLLPLTPKYPGSVFYPPEEVSFGPGTQNQFEYNLDFGQYAPTLRVKSQYTTNLYLRTYVPCYYNKLDSINILYATDSGSGGISVNIRDSIGNLYTPYQGASLSGVGINAMTVSGIPQAGFAENMPCDVEFTFNGISGTSQYLGDIVFAFVAQNP